MCEALRKKYVGENHFSRGAFVAGLKASLIAPLSNFVKRVSYFHYCGRRIRSGWEKIAINLQYFVSVQFSFFGCNLFSFNFV